MEDFVDISIITDLKIPQTARFVPVIAKNQAVYRAAVYLVKLRMKFDRFENFFDAPAGKLKNQNTVIFDQSCIIVVPILHTANLPQTLHPTHFHP